MQLQGFTGITGPTGSSASSSEVPYKSVGLHMGPLCPFLASPRLGAGVGRAQRMAAVPRAAHHGQRVGVTEACL